MAEKQTCPRRVGEMGPWNRGELLDKWEDRGGVKCCSFCGSLHPEAFLEAVEKGAAFGTTTKNYKAYLSGVGSGKVYFQHFRNEDRAKLVELYNAGAIVFEGGFGFGHDAPFPFFFRFEPIPQEGAADGKSSE